MLGNRRDNRILILAVLCWSVGWAAAVSYGHGFEFQRMVATIPGIFLAGILILPGSGRGGAGWTPGLLMAGLTGAYFAVRAACSPVWDLGKMDLLLVCLGLVSLVAGARMASSNRAVWWLLGGMGVVFAANLGVSIIQGAGDSGYAFLRSSRTNQEGVSGLFWHRNYLAGMLELMVPVFLAVALAGGRKSVRIGFGVLTATGLGLAYFSQSRAGLVSVGIGSTATFLVWLLHGWAEWSRQAKIGWLFAGSAAVVVFVAGTLALVSKVSAQRGKNESLEVAIATSDARLAFAGMAYDQWQESPFLGTGSRTFSYLTVRNWDRNRTFNGTGNPEMVHNDYLQTLAEYGVVGLVLIIGLAGMVLVRGMKQAWSREGKNGAISAVVLLGAIGGICGAMLHSVVDFSLHILPNTLLLGLLMGLLLRGGMPLRSEGRESGGVADGSPREPQGGGSRSAVGAGNRERSGRAVSCALVVLAVTGALVAGGRELMALPAWFEFEQGVISAGVSRDRKEQLAGIIERAPDYDLARYYGRITLTELQQRPDEREVLVPDALWAMRLAVARHPFDAESRLNLARTLEAGGDDEAAAREYLVGIAETWRREDKYGGMTAFGDHLARKGEEAFLARKPERALALFRRANEYLEKSWTLNFRPEGGTEYLVKRKFLAGRIRFLEEAGIEAEDLDREIPAPPEE